MREIIKYTVDVLGDIQGLEERLEMKNMMKAPINMKLFFIDFFLKV